ncbi:MAG: hypothetical protein JST68_21085 [Bacteroidetes bacterium]|nr:hypothetical protein [Bacteroidota bacterium]
MTIVVITEGHSIEEVMTFFPAPGNDWIIVKKVEEAPGADLYIDLDFELPNTAALARLLPTPVIVNAVILTLKEIGQPFIRINGWPGFLNRPVHELAVEDEQLAKKLPALYEKLGRTYRLVPDTPGMIGSRILATVINEAYYTWQADVSSQEEIDVAMKLGTNYPTGPFEWGKQIGLERVTGLLQALSKTNERYTPADSLVKAAEVKM